MPRRDQPIGVFDSGVGGLTVLRELRKQLPDEPTIYLGDEARMPYGERDREGGGRFPPEAALETVGEGARVPIIGVTRPGAAAAISATQRRAVGVLATTLTVRSGAYGRAVRDLDPFVDVIQKACPKLVPLVEAGKADGPEALEAVREDVAPLVSEGAAVSPGVDTLLLGCTHYPLLRAAVAAAAGPGGRVVDSATTTSLAVRGVID